MIIYLIILVWKHVIYFHDLYVFVAARKRKQIESSEDADDVSRSLAYTPKQGGKRDLLS
jgi:hypothetical protein